MSFDVVLLFTNVPVCLVVNVAKCRLEADDFLESRTNLSNEELPRILEFCLMLPTSPSVAMYSNKYLEY